ncbi:MAG: PIN domain-containing protein [Okeania sp. SIO3H1]|nr:PIN domain-containing protein [Okeania sp. SIO3H1]
MTETLRLCLDLNIWCAALLASVKGREGTSCQTLVDIVRQGSCLGRKVELVISWGMLNRLQEVLENRSELQILRDDAVFYVEVIRSYAQLRTQLTLGGTGVIPIEDWDDRHVLETAVAGGATALVTGNFRDFMVKDLRVIIPQRHGIYRSGDRSFHLVHPYLMINWINGGEVPPVSDF